MTIQSRIWLMLLLILPVAVMACPESGKNDRLLYGIAFKLAQAGSCHRLEEQDQADCLESVLSEQAMTQPDIHDALLLIRYGNVRRIRACNHHEMRDIRPGAEIPVALWTCHDISPPESTSSADVKTLAFAMVYTDPVTLKIARSVLLPVSPVASHHPVAPEVH
ncbi:hypothetical protein [Alcanivorax sediminis]|uniref:Uncharacterized protein n=2 Tax=Alcanivorax sediminis TaxID=2663008 RepID=A0A6N7LZ67_9GAMM|nr:hypothetical protein [Alcanivorax sediminis]MQX53551.1 hypothetical protein [Alcanivorax sediminis]